MNKPIVVSAFNDNPTYSSFAEWYLKVWNKLGYRPKVAYISDNHDEELIERYSEYGDIIKFDPIPGMHSGVQSKISRIYLAAEQEFFWITDIDLFNLNIKWYEDQFHKCDGTNVLTFGAEGYGGPNAGKWPMSTTIGYGKMFKSIINPNNLSYYELLESWKGIGRKYDDMEDAGNDFPKFSDESLLKRLMWETGNKDRLLHLRRDKPNLFNYHNNHPLFYADVMRRIDRTWNWNINREKLHQGYYIDCCPTRPLNVNDHVIKAIFEYLNIT